MEMNWLKVVAHLQNESQKLYEEVAADKYDLATARNVTSSALVLELLAQALLRGVK